MKNHSLMEQRANLPADDGWADASVEAGERMIRGRLLKFADWKYRAGKEQELIEDGRALAALATVAMWVRWEDGKPVQHIVREPGRRLPERDELGHNKKDEWQVDSKGEPQDPFQNTRLVYFIDPRTAEAFTFSTSSWGGRNAVTDLGDQITRMRSIHKDAVPIVELRAAEMPTQHGRKSKPVFKIIGWKTTSSGGEQATPVEGQITAQQAKREVDRHEMDEDIPF
jgi:hypothetical protein